MSVENLYVVFFCHHFLFFAKYMRISTLWLRAYKQRYNQQKSQTALRENLKGLLVGFQTAFINQSKLPIQHKMSTPSRYSHYIHDRHHNTQNLHHLKRSPSILIVTVIISNFRQPLYLVEWITQSSKSALLVNWSSTPYFSFSIQAFLDFALASVPVKDGFFRDCFPLTILLALKEGDPLNYVDHCWNSHICTLDF